jgi:tryptophan-rich sensory protein
MGAILPALAAQDETFRPRSKTMSLLGIFLVVLGLVLAWKITAFVLRLLFLGVVLVGLYLLVGPVLGPI